MVHRLVLALSAALGLAIFPAAADEMPAGEWVIVESLDGTALPSRLFRPAGEGPFPAVVMLHGCSGLTKKDGTLRKRETQWIGIFAKMGYVVLLPDSFSTRGPRSLCRVKDRPVLPDRERPFDAYGALRWLQEKPYVRPDRIALAGWSNGAMAMLWTLGHEARARPPGLAHDFAAGVGFYPGCIKVGKTAFKASVPVLLQIGLADNWTMPTPCLKLVEASNALGGAVMEADGYDGAVHGFDNPDSTPRAITARNSEYKTGEKQVKVGTHPEARVRAIQRVKAYLGRALKE